jgi:hypothetical protein
LEIFKIKISENKNILSVRSAVMAIELMMVISMAMASDVVIIVFLSLAVGWGVKKNEFFLKIRLKGKKNEFFCVVGKKKN